MKKIEDIAMCLIFLLDLFPLATLLVVLLKMVVHMARVEKLPQVSNLALRIVPHQVHV